jgi:hypothetical protein
MPAEMADCLFGHKRVSVSDFFLFLFEGKPNGEQKDAHFE